jgi:hypothetical protein
MLHYQKGGKKGNFLKIFMYNCNILLFFFSSRKNEKGDIYFYNTTLEKTQKEQPLEDIYKKKNDEGKRK